MSTVRKWYCTCTGKPVEIDYDQTLNDEHGEPTCQRCGASSSSDPKHTIIFRDINDWED